MNKMIIKRSVLTIVTIFSLMALAPALMSTANARAEEAQTTSAESTTAREKAQAQVQEKKDAVQTKLADTKLKACQNREKAIVNIMSRMGDRGQKQMDLFTAIADRTKQFYSDKGKTLDNYEALVSDLDLKKTDAQAAVDATKAASIEFKCDGTDPKGMVTNFKESLKVQNDALKAYKTAVKDLIVGVKSVQSTATSSESTSTGETE